MFELALNVVATVMFLSAAYVMWIKGFRKSAINLIVAVLFSATFVWVVTLYPVDIDQEGEFPLWFNILGSASVLGFVAIAGVLLKMAQALPEYRQTLQQEDGNVTVPVDIPDTVTGKTKEGTSPD
jgi:hypothetical protein